MPLHQWRVYLVQWLTMDRHWGAQAGEAKIREVVMAGGFKQFKRATQTPLNIVYEAMI